MRPLYHVLSLVLLLVLVAGCDSATPDTVPLTAPISLQPGANVPTEVILNETYRITYSTDNEGRFIYDITNLSGNDDEEEGGVSLNSVLLENTCGVQPESTWPSNNVEYDVTINAGGQDVTGVFFQKALRPGQSRTYSYTLSDASEGVIRVVLMQGNHVFVAELPGPCAGLATVDGRVAIDGTLDDEADGIGLRNVVVEAYDGETLVGSAVTDSTGAFAFELLFNAYTTNEAYTIVVPNNEVNAYLYNYFAYENGGTPAAQVVLPEDTDPVVFRFAGDPAALNDALENEFATEALLVRDLRKAIRRALKNKRRLQNLPIRSELIPVLAQITYEEGETEDAYFLDQAPYVFETSAATGTTQWEDDLLNWARDIVDNPAQSDVAEAFRNGLTMQVSYLLDRGVDGADQFDLAVQVFNEDFLIDLLADNGQGRTAGGTVTPQAPGGTGGVIEDFIAMQESYLAGGTGGVIE